MSKCAKCKEDTTFKLSIRLTRDCSWGMSLCKLCWKGSKYFKDANYIPLRTDNGKVIDNNWAVNVYHIGEDTDE